MIVTQFRGDPSFGLWLLQIQSFVYTKNYEIDPYAELDWLLHEVVTGAYCNCPISGHHAHFSGGLGELLYLRVLRHYISVKTSFSMAYTCARIHGLN